MANPNRDSTPYRKLALIIGNDDYSQPNQLNQCTNNALSLHDLLKTINFEVTIGCNLNKQEMFTIIVNFCKTINDGDLILFYFSGHGYQFNDENHLIPVEDADIVIDKDAEDFAINVERTLDRLVDKQPSSVIFILDCCRPYLLKTTRTSHTTIESTGLHKIKPPPKVFIQFANANNQTVANNLFAKYLLKNISKENMNVINVFQRIGNHVCSTSNQEQTPLSMKKKRPTLMHTYLNRVIKSIPDIPQNAVWKRTARTVAGRLGSGSTLDRLHYPKGICVDKNQTIWIADSSNHRIMRYKQDANKGQRVAGKNISGYRPHLLWEPSNVVFDTVSKSFIICDYHNRRVLQWFRGSETFAKVIFENVECHGLAIDDVQTIYLSDTERHEVRRYRMGDKRGKVVAGGNGQGRRLKQLNHPTYICIGPDEAVYVSDSWNDRVIKWDKGAEKGVVVAGGNGKGGNLHQLDCPAGIVVDQLGTLYVADHWNNRVMRWYKGVSQGNVIAGQYVAGDNANQLNGPEGLAFDRDGNLYVSDAANHRIQRFNIKQT